VIYDSVAELIGNTPLVRVASSIHGLQNIDLFAKLEFYNPFGSIKDRVAWGMLKDLLPELMQTGKTVIEASSGNTAKALAALCGMYGLPFGAITNRIKYPEIRGILQVLGCELEELPGLSDCPDPFDPNDFTKYAEDKASRNPEKYHYTDQYFNEANPNAHYETTGKELIDDLGKVDYFFGFLGTCGSTMGAGRFLKEVNPEIVNCGVVGKAGHSIPGGRNMEELWEVGFFTKEFYSTILSGTTAEAIDGMIILNRQCGILCGPTTGLVFSQAVDYLKQIDGDINSSSGKKNAVFIACDRMEPYLSFIKRHRPELLAPKTKPRASVESLLPEQLLNAKELSVEELVGFVEQRESYIVDIRANFAFSTGHIPGSINIIDSTFAQIIEEGMAFPKTKPIIVVCRIGDISRKYSAFLTTQSYEAYSLKGGVQAYKNSDFEQEKSISA
jgi:cysteine synthase B